MLFEKNMDHRDDGTITIGTFFHILAPSPIENSMTGDIALVKTQLPFVVMIRPLALPTGSINHEIKGDHSMGFVLNNLNVRINRTMPIQTTCGGFLCDKQRVEDWNSQKGCGCYHMAQYRSNLAFEHSVFFISQMAKSHIATFHPIGSHNYI